MTVYYFEIVADAEPRIERYWRVETTIAECVSHPSQIHVHRPEPGKGMIETLRTRYPNGRFYELSLAPGEYYPRMARPSSTSEWSLGRNPDTSSAALNTRTTNTGQLHALIGELEQICRVVHPARENFNTFGHDIRNMLILACTDVEAYWQNIMKENGRKASSTKQYVQLALPMKLGEYGVTLPYYPWLDEVFPFRGWVPSERTTQTLKWYSAYNSVKHDRERNFPQATLYNAITAVTGCFVMLCAQ
jgi:hypothetical protein